MADGRKSIIPVKLGDFSVLDSEFNSIRERFDSEMRKMEDEMTKFRSELLNREQSSLFSRSSTTSTSSSSNSALAAPSSLAAPASSDWLTGLHSPLIQEDGQEKKLKLRFDVAQYTPEEIVVKTVDNKLLVHAKHEEKTETKSVYREYNREFLLPKGTNPEMIRSSLSKDGVLTIEAPLPALAAGEKMIPIAQN
jgi:HSP20 family molecular chaperone IbpA